jgi:hypothetical protein
MDQSEAARLGQRLNREIIARFPAGTVQRAALVQDRDDPGLEPDQLLVRVFVIPADPADSDPQRQLDDWARAHEGGMRRLRRELTVRLPSVRLLEFTVESPAGAGAAPRITMAEDPELTVAEMAGLMAQMLSSGWPFPDEGGQLAAALQASVDAGSYDGLDDDPEAVAAQLVSDLGELGDQPVPVRPPPSPMDEPGHQPGQPDR